MRTDQDPNDRGFIDEAEEQATELDLVHEENGRLRRALEWLCAQIEDDGEHGGQSDEDDCNICTAIRDARAALRRRT